MPLLEACRSQPKTASHNKAVNPADETIPVDLGQPSNANSRTESTRTATTLTLRTATAAVRRPHHSFVLGPPARLTPYGRSASWSRGARLAALPCLFSVGRLLERDEVAGDEASRRADAGGVGAIDRAAHLAAGGSVDARQHVTDAAVGGRLRRQ